jgi:hypothetical protein
MVDEDNIVVRKSNLPHASSHLQMNQYLEKHKGIFIDIDGCPRLKNDMFSTRTTPEKKIDKKLHDPHFFDCFRYYPMNFLPINIENL